MLTFVYANIQYPPEAAANGTEGMAVVNFIVELDGTLTNSQIVRNPGDGTGEEALRVVQLFNEQTGGWIPAKQNGEPVRIQYNLPIKFKLPN